MLGTTDQHRFVIVQGPPGTGKTSVIGAYVMMATAAGNGGIWLIAQSNVAVKNIALKLITIGFQNWRILVSKDFHDGWYVHFYSLLYSALADYWKA
jgi:regulator of nonsense transcripts 1